MVHVLRTVEQPVVVAVVVERRGKHQRVAVGHEPRGLGAGKRHPVAVAQAPGHGDFDPAFEAVGEPVAVAVAGERVGVDPRIVAERVVAGGHLEAVAEPVVVAVGIARVGIDAGLVGRRVEPAADLERIAQPVAVAVDVARIGAERLFERARKPIAVIVGILEVGGAVGVAVERRVRDDPGVGRVFDPVGEPVAAIRTFDEPIAVGILAVAGLERVGPAVVVGVAVERIDDAVAVRVARAGGRLEREAVEEVADRGAARRVDGLEVEARRRLALRHDVGARVPAPGVEARRELPLRFEGAAGGADQEFDRVVAGPAAVPEAPGERAAGLGRHVLVEAGIGVGIDLRVLPALGRHDAAEPAGPDFDPAVAGGGAPTRHVGLIEDAVRAVAEDGLLEARVDERRGGRHRARGEAFDRVGNAVVVVVEVGFVVDPVAVVVGDVAIVARVEQIAAGRGFDPVGHAAIVAVRVERTGLVGGDFEAVGEAVAVAVGVARIGLAAAGGARAPDDVRHDAVAVRVFDPVVEPIAVGVGHERVGVEPRLVARRVDAVAHLAAVAEAVAVAVGVERVGVEFRFVCRRVGAASHLESVVEPVAVRVRVERIGVQPRLIGRRVGAVSHLGPVAEPVVVRVRVVRVGAEFVLPGIEEPVVVGVRARPVGGACIEAERVGLPVVVAHVGVQRMGVRRRAEDEHHGGAGRLPVGLERREGKEEIEEVVGRIAKRRRRRLDPPVRREGPGLQEFLGVIGRRVERVLHRVLFERDLFGVGDAVDDRQILVVAEVAVSVEFDHPAERREPAALGRVVVEAHAHEQRVARVHHVEGRQLGRADDVARPLRARHVGAGIADGLPAGGHRLPRVVVRKDLGGRRARAPEARRKPDDPAYRHAQRRSGVVRALPHPPHRLTSSPLRAPIGRFEWDPGRRLQPAASGPAARVAAGSRGALACAASCLPGVRRSHHGGAMIEQRPGGGNLGAASLGRRGASTGGAAAGGGGRRGAAARGSVRAEDQFAQRHGVGEVECGAEQRG